MAGAQMGSHRRVTVIVIIVNMVWLLPCAAVAALHSDWAAWIAVISLTILLITRLPVSLTCAWAFASIARAPFGGRAPNPELQYNRALARANWGSVWASGTSADERRQARACGVIQRQKKVCDA